MVNIRKNTEETIDAAITRMKTELTLSFLCVDLGKYLIRLELNPKKLNVVSKDILDINVVAIPTSLAGNIRAITIQKKNPKTATMNVLVMTKSELRYR